MRIDDKYEELIELRKHTANSHFTISYSTKKEMQVFTLTNIGISLYHKDLPDLLESAINYIQDNRVKVDSKSKRYIKDDKVVYMLNKI